MPRSSRRGPSPRRCTSASASSNPTSVKTATVCSELEDVPPDPRTAVPGARFRLALAARTLVVGQDLVGRRVGLRLDGDVLGLAADAEFVDLVAAVLDVDALNLLVLASGRFVRVSRLLRLAGRLIRSLGILRLDGPERRDATQQD